MCMKKFGAFLLAGCLLCVGAQVLPEQNTVSITAKADGFDETISELFGLPTDSNGIRYSIHEDTSTGYDGYAVAVGATEAKEEITIPDGITLGGKQYVVTEIGAYTGQSFQSAETLTALHIGKNVKSISSNRFSNYSLLKEIEFPEGLETIEAGAFSGCGFETLTFPKSLTSVADTAFSNNKNLKSVEFPGGNDLVIGKGNTASSVFSGCSNLETIIMGEGVKALNPYAFTKLSGLKNIQLSPTLQTIGNSTFQNCTALEEIEIPASVETIGEHVFDGCSNLKTIKFNEGLKKINNYSFRNCGVEELTIPSTVETFSIDYADKLKTITFLGKDTTIGDIIYCNKALIVRGYEGSTAEKMAKYRGYTFEALDAEAPTEPTAEILLGDADQNGEVDILDVISINKAILGKENLSENGLKAIDFNGNEKPDSDEAMKVLKFIVGLIEDFNA